MIGFSYIGTSQAICTSFPLAHKHWKWGLPASYEFKVLFDSVQSQIYSVIRKFIYNIGIRALGYSIYDIGQGPKTSKINQVRGLSVRSVTKRQIFEGSLSDRQKYILQNLISRSQNLWINVLSINQHIIST